MHQTLWTIQHENAYREFEKTGVLRADEEHLFCEDDFRFAYDWLAQEMTIRVGPPPPNVRYPVWAWYQWEGKQKRRDLRCSGYAFRGTPMVQIEFEADTKSFLLSDFDTWHIVLANQFVSNSEYEWDLFYKQTLKPHQEDIQSSWGRIFDLTRYTPGWDCKPDKKSIQATLWQVEMSQVRKVEHFIAK